MELVVSILLYPGLLLALILGGIFRWLTEGRVPRGRPRVVPLSGGGLAGLVSIGLAALALALLPWPLHPASAALVGSPLLLWAAIEGAFLAPLLPGMLASAPLAARAAIREAQIGTAGRFAVWLAIGVALWSDAGWTTIALPGRAMAALAGLLALPAAIGAGPFGAERSLSEAAAEEGLDEATADLLRFARAVRGAVLLVALVVVSLPLALVRPPLALALIVALFLVIVLVLRRISLALPRRTLPDALRWCWWRALPLAAAGLLYLAIV